MYKCLIVDDEELARDLIETHLAQLDEFELVASCESALGAQKILRSESIDLMFLDIEMPVLKGTDFLKVLERKPKVIFTTAYRDYAIEGFELNAVDYLLKPIIFDRFFQAIQKFLSVAKRPIAETSSDEKKGYIYVPSSRKNVKIDFDHVLYAESLKGYVRIQLVDGEVTFKSGFTALEGRLDDRFVRIHRSYIVNKSKITAFTKHDVEIGKKELPIGEIYKESVLQELSG